LRLRLGVLVLMLTLGGLLAACGPAAAPTPEVPPDATPTMAAAPISVPEAAQTSADPSPAGATPTARAGLEASDPTTLDLASGKPALVEFFAFW